MEEPKVSVLIPSYNQENVIEQTVMSALTQDYDNLEVVVSDDASKDRTPQILKEIQRKYPERLKIFLHQTNLGVTKNHNRGLLECRGERDALLARGVGAMGRSLDERAAAGAGSGSNRAAERQASGERDRERALESGQRKIGQHVR